MLIILNNSGLLSVDVGLAIWILLSFLVFLFIFWRYGWKHIAFALEKREASIADSLEKAEKARNATQGLLAKNKVMIQEALKEAQQIRHQSIEDADKIRQKRIEEARLEARTIVEGAKEAIKQEKQHALVELQKHVAELSIQAAGLLLRENLDNSKNYKLVKEVIDNYAHEVA